MDRIVYSKDMITGEPYSVLNPPFLYLDTSVWIDIYDIFERENVRIIDLIAETIEDSEYRLLVSTINFLELIKTAGDISRNFAVERTKALDYVRMMSAMQPTLITDQEVFRFLDQGHQSIRIFDTDNVALSRLSEGVSLRKVGETDWFVEQRWHIDEVKERDRVLDLEADIWELSGVRPPSSSIILTREHILNGPLGKIGGRKQDLIEKRKPHIKNIGRTIPAENKFILDYALNRMTANICKRFGSENVSMVSSHPHLLLKRDSKLFFEILAALKRGAELKFNDVKAKLPGLYWQAKITYHNYYYGKRSAGGQSGDRNHAIYLPYSNYFGTCDKKMIKAISTEYPVASSWGNIHLFRIA